jgi:hypothetical protein
MVMVESTQQRDPEPDVAKPRVVVKGANGRRQLIEDYPLGPGEFLVEVTDRVLEERAYLVAPNDPEAEVVAKFTPMLRKALFADGAELRLKTIYKVKKLRGIERCLEPKTGKILDTRVLSLFVIKRGPPA